MRKATDTIDAGFMDRYAAPSVAGLPKYAQLREILIAALTSGLWKAGDKLPTEMELVRQTPFSLGTVQKALRALVDEGLITRAQGSGTFVTKLRQPIDAPLHLRFLGNQDEPRFLPLYPKVLARRRVTERGPWSDWLQQRGDAIVCIDRKLSVNGEFTLFNRFYFSAATFPRIARQPLTALDGANLKQLLGSTFNMPINAVEQRVLLVKFTPAICAITSVKTGTTGILLESAASVGRGTPLYFLESFIPPNRRKLDIST